MRIGILTLPLHNNYGGLLQNFALQEFLRKMGHTVVTLDVTYQPCKISPLARTIKFVARLLKKITGDKSVLFVDVVKQVMFYNLPQKNQKEFIDKYIIKETFSAPLDITFWDSHDFDALIVGSDQVWRKRFSPFILNYFLDFAEGKDNLKKLSYAASFGVDYWDGGEDLIEPVKRLLEKFTAVSVREKSGVDICKSVFCKDATLVLDPTLLLTADDYRRILPEQKNAKIKTCAVYILDEIPGLMRRINNVCYEKGLSVKRIGRPDRKGFPSLESWLSEIFSSDYVITDSFHGTVFSIIAHKKFTTIINRSRGATRFETLLDMFDLKGRLEDINGELIKEKSIDYDEIENRLDEYRRRSYEFITTNLTVK